MMLEAIWQLVYRGFPISAAKLKLLMRTVNVLGFLLHQDLLQLGHKALRKLFGSELPRTQKDLQALLGRLNFAGGFIPDYKRRIEPLV